MLYGQVFPLLMRKDAEKKATSPTGSTDKQNDFGENVVVNGYGTGSENGDENDGWTTVKSKKQGEITLIVFCYILGRVKKVNFIRMKLCFCANICNPLMVDVLICTFYCVPWHCLRTVLLCCVTVLIG